MAHIGMIDDSESPSKNAEVGMPCTILEIPKMEVYGARFYTRDNNGYKKAVLEIHHKDTASKLKEKKLKSDESKLGSLKTRLGEFSDITALMVAYPRGMSVEQHRHMRFESALGGTNEEKLNFISSRLGKEVKVAELVKSGEFVDVSSVTKGKGWAGTIKRFGTARLFHKATQKVRHIGTLGAFTPGKVLFTVPQAGQLGFNYRTESNKRILKVGTTNDIKSIAPKAGFTNYGLVRNDYVIVKGSIGGPAKRLVRIRKSENRNKKGIKEPKINYISTTE
jgi:large subunit ribosomal protein L3